MESFDSLESSSALNYRINQWSILEADKDNCSNCHCCYSDCQVIRVIIYLFQG